MYSLQRTIHIIFRLLVSALVPLHATRTIKCIQLESYLFRSEGGTENERF